MIFNPKGEIKTNQMKTSKSTLIMISLFSTIVFASCTKNDETLRRNTALLISQSWKFEIYGHDENNNGMIEESENSMLACEADDSFTFNANGTGVFASGTMPCSIGEPATTNFSWNFANNGTELAIFAAPEKINRLDETILEVYYMDQNSLGQPVKYIRRFQH